MERVILGLGSNKGDKRQYLKNAVESLDAILSEMRCSSIYRTSPQDYLLQDDFYNMVVAGMCGGNPFDFLKRIQEIEARNGRDRKKEIPKGPRTLDIDILFFGKLKINNQELVVPHPAIKMRAFVMIPLLELFPDFREDGSSFFYRDLLCGLGEQKVEKIF